MLVRGIMNDGFVVVKIDLDSCIIVKLKFNEGLDVCDLMKFCLWLYFGKYD